MKRLGTTERAGGATVGGCVPAPGKRANGGAGSGRARGRQRRRCLATWAVAVLFAATGMGALAPPARAQGCEDPVVQLYGMNIDPWNPAGNPSAAELQAAGVRWVRIEFKEGPGFGFFDPVIAAGRTIRACSRPTRVHSRPTRVHSRPTRSQDETRPEVRATGGSPRTPARITRPWLAAAPAASAAGRPARTGSSGAFGCCLPYGVAAGPR